jgi:hypothetical protein
MATKKLKPGDTVMFNSPLYLIVDAKGRPAHGFEGKRAYAYMTRAAARLACGEDELIVRLSDLRGEVVK